MIPILVGASFGLGLAFVFSVIIKPRPSLEARVTSWAATPTHVSHDSTLTRSVLAQVWESVTRALSASTSISNRLARMRWDITVAQFRAQQLISGCLGASMGVALGLAAMMMSNPSPIVLVMLVVLGFAVGFIARDQWLTKKVKEREQKQAEEFPTIAELLALAVAAGQPPSAALERIVEISHGEFCDELRFIVAEIRTGTRFVDAFDSLAMRTEVTSIARFAESLGIAVDRGTPLIEVLHAQAADVRESARRQMIETAARKEIAMMLPVVFLLLPVTVVIAFYPGFIGLSLGP